MRTPPETPREEQTATLFAPRKTNSQASASSGGGEGMDRLLRKRFWTTRRLALTVGAVVFLALVGYGFWTTTGGRRLNVETDKLTLGTVEQGPFQEMISATGNVLPLTTVYLDAVEGGRVEEIFIQEGAMVTQGQPILRLSNSTLQLSLLNTEAQRLEQASQLEQNRFQMEESNLNRRQQLTDMDYNILRLKREYDRASELVGKQVISQQEFDRVQDEYEYWVRRKDLTLQSFRQDSMRQNAQIGQMVQSVRRMDENFGILQQQLANLTLRAPVSGQLTALNAELGELRGAGFRFGQIDVLDGYKVRAGIDEFYINRVQRGQQAVTQALGGTEYPMLITRVYPEVRDGRFEVDMEFARQTPPDIRRGQTIRFRLEMSDPTEAVTVPRGGFYQSTGGNWVYVVDPSGQFATRRAVRLGRQNPQVFEVLEGLEPGERVITSGYEAFGEADRLVLQ